MKRDINRRARSGGVKKRERSGSGLMMNDPFLLNGRLGHADSLLSSAFS